MVLGGVQDYLEVVVRTCRGRDAEGVERHLALPLLASGAFGNHDGVVVVTGREFGIGDLCPALIGEVEAYVACVGSEPEVVLRRGVPRLGLVFVSAALGSTLRHELISPGDVGRAVYEDDFPGGLLHELVAGVLQGFGVGDVGKVGAFGEAEPDFLYARVIPVPLEMVGGGVTLDGCHVVFAVTGIVIGHVAGVLVYINLSVARVVGVFSALGEAHEVVIEAHALLFVGAC